MAFFVPVGDQVFKVRGRNLRDSGQFGVHARFSHAEKLQLQALDAARLKKAKDMLERARQRDIAEADSRSFTAFIRARKGVA